MHATKPFAVGTVRTTLVGSAATLWPIIVAMLIAITGCAPAPMPQLGATKSGVQKLFGQSGEVHMEGKQLAFKVNGRTLSCRWDNTEADSPCEKISFDVPYEDVEKLLKAYSQGMSWGVPNLLSEGNISYEDWVRSDGVVARWFDNGFVQGFYIMTPREYQKSRKTGLN